MPKKVPSYRHHKATGQAVVTIDRKEVYLGKHGSPESHQRYAEAISRWQSRQTEAPKEITVRHLTVVYLKFAESYYIKDGKPTTEVQTIRDALKRLNRLHRNQQAEKFTPKMLKALQNACIDDGLSRTTINATVARVRRMFRWAVSEELVPTSVIVGLDTVRDLCKGRTPAKEPEPVRPVSTEHINLTLPKLPRQVRDMVRLQLLCGCRPAEITILRPCDIDRTGDVWEYTPASHKTEHHGKERRIYFGPRAQAILEDWIEDRPAEAYCFSPAEAEAERREQQRQERQTPVQPSQRKRAEEAANRKSKRRRQPQEHYSTASYRRAIARACEEAGIPAWSPNQLRHSRATDLRKMFGIEAAQTVAGHSSLNTTLLYAEANFERARAIMGEVG